MYHKTGHLPSSQDDTKTEMTKSGELDSPNPVLTFHYDDKSRGLVGQQLYNEKSAVCFDTHFIDDGPGTNLEPIYLSGLCVENK